MLTLEPFLPTLGLWGSPWTFGGLSFSPVKVHPAEPCRLTLGPWRIILGPWRLILGLCKLTVEPCMLTLKSLHAQPGFMEAHPGA
jgi:hypothetical protein